MSTLLVPPRPRPVQIKTVHGRSSLLRGANLLRIERWEPRREGELSEYRLRQKLEARGYEVSSSTWPSMTTLAGPRDHRGRVVAIVAGLAKITIERESAILADGDMVYLPPGAAARLDMVGFSPVRCLEASESQQALIETEDSQIQSRAS